MAIIGTSNDTLMLIRDSDRGTDYGAGDIVQVFPGDVGVNVPPAPPFYIVLVTGLLFDEALQYQNAAFNPDGTLVHKRVFTIQLHRLPKAYKDLLESQRWFSVAWSSISQFVLNKLA